MHFVWDSVFQEVSNWWTSLGYNSSQAVVVSIEAYIAKAIAKATIEIYIFTNT